MSKKIRFGFFVLALLFSCEDNSKDMRFSSWQSSPTEERLVRVSLDSFSHIHPEITYKYQPIPGNYTEKLQLMLGTGKSPDLFWLKGDTSPAYMSFEVLHPLDSLLIASPSFDIDDFFPVFRDAFKYNDTYYGFGKDFNAYVLFYNTKMFQEAGITEPPKNWKELRDYAKPLTKDRDNIGSESFVYFRFNGNPKERYCFRSSSYHVYHVGDHFNIGFDMDRIRFFETDSGLRLL